jgi:hypothetical protein
MLARGFHCLTKQRGDCGECWRRNASVADSDGEAGKEEKLVLSPKGYAVWDGILAEMRKKAVRTVSEHGHSPCGTVSHFLADFFRILLDVVLRETATESLLFGEVIGIVQGRQVRNPFFRFFATL